MLHETLHLLDACTVLSISHSRLCSSSSPLPVPPELMAAVHRPTQQVAPLVPPPQHVLLVGGDSILLYLCPDHRQTLCRISVLCTADITVPNLLIYTLGNNEVKRAPRTGLNQK